MVLQNGNRQLRLETLEWLAVVTVVGLHHPDRRGWRYFRRNSVNDADAKLVADDLEEGLKKPVPFYGSSVSKQRLREVVNFARAGGFIYKNEIEPRIGEENE